MQLEVNDFTMAYTDSGGGRPLLFIHGYPLSRKMWNPQVKGLSNLVRVIAPDLRGHGESQPVPGPYSMDLFADDIAALLDGLKIQKRVLLCGLSMGGYVALAFYRKYPDRVAALILAATRAADDTPQARAGRDQAAETARTNGVEAVIDGMIPKLLSPNHAGNDPALVAKVKSTMTISLEGMLGDLAGMKARPDSRPMLGEISVPALILHGTEDQVVPPHEAKEMKTSIPHSRLQLIPEAGHLINLEQTAVFNAAVRSFISGMKQEG